MIINQKETTVVESNVAFETIASKINNKKLVKLYSLLSDIYKNPQGSIVREYASNAYDANVEAYNFAKSTYEEIKVKYPWILDEDTFISEEEFYQLKSSLKRVDENEPIIVGLRENQNQIELFIKDFGIGLSPNRMLNIFFDYLSSTKESTDDEIGGFGIGAKSALSIYNQFFITTVYNGIQYKYMMGKNTKGEPEGTPLHKSEYDSSLENGTTISMFIKPSEVDNYVQEFGFQLAYLNNVYFDFTQVEKNSFLERKLYYIDDDLNDFKIYEYPDFYLKSNPPYNQMHLSVGNITYPLDFHELDNINTVINFPVALKFKIGELQPTPSREAIKYTEDAKKKIEEKIKKVRQFMINKCNENAKETDDFFQFIQSLGNTGDSFKFNNVDVDMTNLLNDYNYKISRAKYKPFEERDIKITSTYAFYTCLRGNGFLSTTSARKLVEPSYRRIPNLATISQYNNKFILSNKDDLSEFSSFRKNANVVETYFSSKSNISIFKIDYDSLINSVNKDSSFVIKCINDYIKSLDNFFNFQECVPLPEWHWRYENGLSNFSPKKKVKSNDTVGWLYYFNSNSEWGKHNLKVKELENYKGNLVYALSSEKDELTSIIKILHSHSSYKYRFESKSNSAFYNSDYLFIIVSKDDYDYLEENSMGYNIEKFVSNDVNLRNIITAKSISDKYYTIRAICNICTDFNSELDTSYNKYKEFLNKYNFSFYNNYSEAEEKLFSQYEADNVLNDDVINEYKYLLDYCEGLELIFKLRISDIKNEDDKVANLIKEYLEFKNKKVD